MKKGLFLKPGLSCLKKIGVPKLIFTKKPSRNNNGNNVIKEIVQTFCQKLFLKKYKKDF